jgi:hypothetical protein
VKEGLREAQPEDLIFLGGSTFTVADYLSWVKIIVLSIEYLENSIR